MAVLSVGDELLSGDIVDSNKAHIAAWLRDRGLELRTARTCLDREKDIVRALHELAAGAQLILVTGGLGPTTDDLTASSVAAAAGVGLERDAEVEDRLRAFFASRGREVIEANLKQADLPQASTRLDNPIGTAPGFAVELTVEGCPGDAGRALVCCMPGVPREMKLMLQEQIGPLVDRRFELQPRARRVYRMCGRGESTVQAQLTPHLDAMAQRSAEHASVLVHYRAHYPEVSVILEACPDPDTGQALDASDLEAYDEGIRTAMGEALYGVGEAALVEVVHEALRSQGLTLAVAESCTGGGLGAMLTERAGSSDVFLGGFCTYANAAKEALLGVSGAALQEHGAVSAPVAEAMAEGARSRLGADLALSITGVAGPGGGSPEKPVGTVFLGFSGSRGARHRRVRIYGKRGTVREAAARLALKFLLDELGDSASAPTADEPEISL